MELDPAEQHQAARALRERRKKATKRNLAASAAITHKHNTTQEERDEEDLGRLQSCQDLLAQLPKGSRYANHRRRVVQRAMQLLRTRKQQRSSAMEAELEKLLQTLQLG